jgi:hypothetical protein
LNSTTDRLNSITVISEKLKTFPNNKKDFLLEKLEKNSNVDIPSDLGADLILSWDDVKEMNEFGIDFGAHTVTHPILTRIPLNQARFEIMQSRKDIEKKLGKTVDTFCYPNGLPQDFNTNIIDLVKESGYTCAVTTIPTIPPLKSNLYKLGRLPYAWSYNSFKFFVSGLYSDASNFLNHFRRSHAI